MHPNCTTPDNSVAVTQYLPHLDEDQHLAPFLTPAPNHGRATCPAIALVRAFSLRAGNPGFPQWVEWFVADQPAPSDRALRQEPR